MQHTLSAVVSGTFSKEVKVLKLDERFIKKVVVLRYFLTVYLSGRKCAVI